MARTGSFLVVALSLSLDVSRDPPRSLSVGHRAGLVSVLTGSFYSSASLLLCGPPRTLAYLPRSKDALPFASFLLLLIPSLLLHPDSPPEHNLADRRSPAPVLRPSQSLSRRVALRPPPPMHFLPRTYNKIRGRIRGFGEWRERKTTGQRRRRRRQRRIVLQEETSLAPADRISRRPVCRIVNRASMKERTQAAVKETEQKRSSPTMDLRKLLRERFIPASSLLAPSRSLPRKNYRDCRYRHGSYRAVATYKFAKLSQSS